MHANPFFSKIIAKTNVPSNTPNFATKTEQSSLILGPSQFATKVEAGETSLEKNATQKIGNGSTQTNERYYPPLKPGQQPLPCGCNMPTNQQSGNNNINAQRTQNISTWPNCQCSKPTRPADMTIMTTMMRLDKLPLPPILAGTPSTGLGQIPPTSTTVQPVTGFCPTNTGIAISPAQSMAYWPRPIWLGCSGGNIKDLVNNQDGSKNCCSGTLGSLVQGSTDGVLRQFILSNFHVFVVDRDNPAATPGKLIVVPQNGAANDYISQPGLIDNRCSVPGSVATLTSYVGMGFDEDSQAKGRPRGEGSAGVVDAAIAEVLPGPEPYRSMVDPRGPILGIGWISGLTAVPTDRLTPMSMCVQKVGRTTGRTHGMILGANSTVTVAYAPCGSTGVEGAPVVTYKNQLVIGGTVPGVRFSMEGDSGALVLTDPADGSPPDAVGLLFSGGWDTDRKTDVTFANPINDVLSAIGGLQLVGSQTYRGPPGTVVRTTAGVQSATYGNMPGAGATNVPQVPYLASNTNSKKELMRSAEETDPCLVRAAWIRDQHEGVLAEGTTVGITDPVMLERARKAPYPNYTGSAIGYTADGRAGIIVMVTSIMPGGLYPTCFYGVPAEVVKTGVIRPL